jgi:glycosyltransferase involved in cell wall biosynthesis
MENRIEPISICVPAYEMNGAGLKALKRLLQTIEKQDFNDYEVIISDHSDNSLLENLIKSFNNDKFKHFYYKNNKGSSSANINNAISLANHDIIKIMFQDDFFVTTDALSVIEKEIKNNFWGACSCIHYNSEAKQYYNTHICRWQDDIKSGVNTIGSPSVSFFRKNDLTFDERLIWFMDTDFYYRLYQKYGYPHTIPYVLVGICEDSTRVTNTLINDEVKNKEYAIIKEKFNL